MEIALKYYSEAADKGNLGGLFNLALCYENG